MRAPAARVMDSFMMLPPMSLQPLASRAAARSGPIFTQDACRHDWSISGSTASIQALQQDRMLVSLSMRSAWAVTWMLGSRAPKASLATACIRKHSCSVGPLRARPGPSSRCDTSAFLSAP